MVIDLVLNSEICCVEKHRVRVPGTEREKERERLFVADAFGIPVYAYGTYGTC